MEVIWFSGKPAKLQYLKGQVLAHLMHGTELGVVPSTAAPPFSALHWLRSEHRVSFETIS
jgi:hypothetical protein